MDPFWITGYRSGLPMATHFEQRGLSVEVIPLHGSVELAPLVDLADRLVDIVETGNTLRAKGLVELEQISSFEAALIVNRASQWTRADQVAALVQGISEVLARQKTEENR